MKVSIMQPYFLPYIGYFQLLNISDKFIIFDDVNYINKGWIDRNRINVNNKDFFFKIPLEKKSQNLKINEIKIINDNTWKKKLLKTLSYNYKNAPHYESISNLIEDILFYNEKNLSRFIKNSLLKLIKFMNIECEISNSSEYDNPQNLKNTHRIIDICNKEKSSEYINLSGGIDIYDQNLFKKSNLNIKFISSMTEIKYNKSIIDLLFYELDNLNIHLNNFQFLKNC